MQVEIFSTKWHVSLLKYLFFVKKKKKNHLFLHSRNSFWTQAPELEFNMVAYQLTTINFGPRHRVITPIGLLFALEILLTKDTYGGPQLLYKTGQ